MAQLRSYRAKRDFTKTTEPRGQVSGARQDFPLRPHRDADRVEGCGRPAIPLDTAGKKLGRI